MRRCAKCKSIELSYSSTYWQRTDDEMTWVCKTCGYEETQAMRRRRRIPRRLLALLIMLAFAVGIGGYLLYAAWYFITEFGTVVREMVPGLIVIAVFLVLVLIFVWAGNQLQNGGIAELWRDLKRKSPPKRDT